MAVLYLSGIVLLAWLGGVLYLYFMQSSLIFLRKQIIPPSKQYLAAFRQHEIEFKHQGIKLKGWLVKKHPQSLIIFFAGSGEDVAIYLDHLDKFGQASALLINYRGYGESQGQPAEQCILADALYLFDQTCQQLQLASQQVILFGRSLGAGVAAYVASQRRVKQVILVSPYDSILQVARQSQQQMKYLPLGFLLKHTFKVEQYARQAICPALCLLAGCDETIANERSLSFIKQWRGHCRYVPIDSATHNTMANYPLYWQEIQSFLVNKQ